jgi:hypothetical protein
MINITNNKSTSFDDKLLAEGQSYTVGINDGVHFKKVIFKGTKLFNGKEMMVFSTEEKQQITINPSYHSFTIEEEMDNINHIVQNQSNWDNEMLTKEEISNNGKINRK